MFIHSWQRQLEALLARLDKEVAQRGHEDRRSRFPLNRSLGFVDMVSYTSSSTILGDALVGLIERFEEESRNAVVEAGGRVVKMIGDAVLYIADDLPTGLRVATSLTAAAIAAGKGGHGYELEEFPTADLRGFGPVSPYVLSAVD